MRRLRDFLFVRHRHNWVLLVPLRAGRRLRRARQHGHADPRQAARPRAREADRRPARCTDFNVRWYHVYSTIAFLVANLWNFQLNRSWTFRTTPHAPSWWREYWPFVTVGLLGQLVGLVLLTLLMHPRARRCALPASVFDDSTGSAHAPLLGPAHRHRRRHPRLLRAQQAVDLRGRAHPPPRPRRPGHTEAVTADEAALRRR